MTATRATLPNRRQSQTVAFTHRNHKHYGTWSCFGPDLTRPAEVFLDCGKPGSDVQAIARDAAVAVSLGLQYGVPLDALRGAITRLDDGSPASTLGTLLDKIAEASE